MGRVEEAMRKAREVAPTEPLASDPGRPDALALDFPVEAAQGEVTDLAEEPLSQETTSPASDEGLELNSTPEETSFATLATKLVGDERMLTTSREQYRRLAASLHHIQSTSGIKVVLIASAVAGEGKTLTAANLALTFSESYARNVLLIDADLRRPSLARTFGVDTSPGLTEGLLEQHKGPLPLQELTPRLTLLPAGRATNDPMAGLTSGRMRAIIDEARAAFDWVIVDTPPIGLMTDANLLSAIADGTVLVVKANSTPFNIVQRAIDALGRDHIIGAVLNRSIERNHGDRYYDYYRYGASPNGVDAP